MSYKRNYDKNYFKDKLVEVDLQRLFLNFFFLQKQNNLNVTNNLSLNKLLSFIFTYRDFYNGEKRNEQNCSFRGQNIGYMYMYRYIASPEFK